MDLDPNVTEVTRPKKPFPWVFVFLAVVAFCAGLPLLATLVLPATIGRLGFAQHAMARAEMTMLQGALAEYALRNGGQYPDTLDALVEPDADGTTLLGEGSVPEDPWSRAYLYQVTEDGKSYVLESLGKDGEVGGTEEDEDLRATPMPAEAK